MYADGAELRKAVVDGAQNIEYYFWDGELFFAFVMDYDNGQGKPVDYRLYFSNQEIIRLLIKYQSGGENIEVPSSNPMYHEYGNMILALCDCLNVQLELIEPVDDKNLGRMLNMNKASLYLPLTILKIK